MTRLKLSSGVIAGNALKELFAYCKEVDCALPAVNVIGWSSANAALAAAKEARAPIIVQLSQTGSPRAAHMVRTYRTRWPDHPFRFRIPFQQVRWPTYSKRCSAFSRVPTGTATGTMSTGSA